ncbi:MAG: thiamine pyrophosphate-dependent dehydrogenase E1 component subunit alpha [Euzebyaceae bacterium]|nr:thiamine pyrophosphate-dependent dehydrogenase E1 component subunit alpha [Euzebyaceae bacterium]
MTATEALLDRRGGLRDRVARLERMLEIRALEDRVQALFSEGLVHGTTHTAQGQEAVAVGVAAATRPTDVVTCTYRGHAVALALGLTVEDVLGEIMGRTIGSVGGVGGSMHLCEPDVGLLPTFAIVGAGIPVAVGAGLSAQLRGGDDIAVAVFGDGATNIGAFHEGLNLAAIWQLPVLFVCEHNVYGEYSRFDLTTPVADVSVRGASYAIPSATVDGQDVDVVVAAVEEAVTAIRAGGGPRFLEFKTYRYAGHSRSDTAPYRPEGEMELWRERDPIDRFTERLLSEDALDAAAADAMAARVAARVDEAVETVKASPVPDAEAMFRHVYAPNRSR